MKILKSKTIISTLLLIAFFGSLVQIKHASADANTNINTTVCSHGHNSPNITLSDPSNGLSQNQQINAVFRIDWGKSLNLKLNGNNVTLSEAVNYQNNQLLTQNLTLQPGNNTISAELTGGCPETTINRMFNINFEALRISVNPKETKIRSPQLTGVITDHAARVEITIDSKTYNVTNNGNGTWTLPAGAINPDLKDGSYTVVATAFDPNTNVQLISQTFTDIIKIKNKNLNVQITTEEADSRQPEITGTVDDPNAEVVVEINGKTYNAINNGDGTWTIPAGTVDPLTNGEYIIIANAFDVYGNRSTYQSKINISAAKQLGFILSPNTGYFRVHHTNIPTIFVYLGLLFIITGLIIRKKLKKNN